MTGTGSDNSAQAPVPDNGSQVALAHPSRTRRPWHRLPTVLTWFVGLALLGAMFLQVAGWWLVPWLDANPKWVQSILTRELKRPVRFGQFEAVWRRSGPLLQLRDLEISDPTRRTQPLKLARAEFAVHIYAWTRPGSPWTEFRVVAPRLSVERDTQGRWRLRGFDGQRVDADGNVLLDIGRVSLSDATVEVFDRGSGSRWHFDRVHARIENDWLGRRFGAHARARDSAQPVRIACRSDKHWREGRCFVAGRKLSLLNWQPRRETAGSPWTGQIDLAAWFDWSKGQRSVRADVGIMHAALSSMPPTRLRVDGPALSMRKPRPAAGTGSAPPDTVARSAATRVAAPASRWRIAWQHSDQTGWQIDARHALGNTLRVRGAGDDLLVEAARIDLTHWLPLVQLAPQVSPRLREWLREAAPEGSLLHVSARRSGARWRHVAGELHAVGWRPRGATPGLAGIDARVVGDATALLFVPEKHGRMSLTSQDFSAPFAIDWRGGVVGVMATDSGTRIEGAGLDFGVASAKVAGRFALEFEQGGGKPFADLAVAVEGVAIDSLRNYWSRTRMPPKTVRWLDESLHGGEVLGSRAVVYGDLDDWPFREGSGRFEARARVAGVALAFRPDWPTVAVAAANVAFIGGGMHVDILRATTAGLDISAATADIERLREPVLNIHASGRGPGNAMLGYLRASPIRANVGPAIEGLGIEGDGGIEIALGIPLKKSLGETTVEGSVELLEADIADTKWDIALDDASGILHFDRRSFIAEDWPVRFDGDPARLTLRSGTHVLDPERNEFEAELTGDLRAQSLLTRVPQLAPLGARFEGRSDFNVRVAIGQARGDSARSQRLEVASSLRGVALTLPAPLTKAPAAALPIAVSVDLPFEQGEVRIEVGDKLRARARAADALRPFTAHFALGAAALPEMPASGIRVSGRTDAVDVLGWASLVREFDRHLESMAASSPAGARAQATTGTAQPMASSPAIPVVTPSPQKTLPQAAPLPLQPAVWTAAQRFAGLDLAADAWMLGGRRFGALTVKGDVIGDSLRFRVAGAGAQGQILLPVGMQQSSPVLNVQFERLHLPETKAGSTPATASNVDPAKLPSLRVDIADFRMGRAQLGKVVLRSRPLERGMRVDTLTAKSPRMTLDAEGEWLRDDRGERSQVLAEFRSPDVGALLSALGFEGVVAGGTTRAELNGQWRGAPMDFALAKIEGTLSVAVGAGRILEVEPGAGRVFGLVNLQAIRRRLSLDFSDFFTPGMAFDRIDGDFQMRAGNAYTANVVLRAPAAEVRVRGRTGLAGKDYDQQVEVRPRVGSALPVMGAVAAGPAGAALGWVMQRALEKPLGFAARTRYRVTGPWSKPTITQLPRLPSLRAAPPDAAANDS